MSGQIDADRILDAFLAPEADRLPDRVIEAALADVARTPQRRALRVPWRFHHMRLFPHATAIASVALVAVVGLVYLNSRSPGGPGAPTTPTEAPTTAPTASPSPKPSAPGITGWTPYTSEFGGFTMGYPEDWSVHSPATREWQPGDMISADPWPFADTFISPEQDPVGLFVWEMPLGDEREADEDRLKAWAQDFCDKVGETSCEGFAQRAVPMCHNAGGDSCRPAILVPTADQQYAFFVDWTSAMFTGSPDLVRVVVVAREDGFPSAARYGGSVQLLKAILTTMDVWAPGQAQLDPGWITHVESVP